MQPALLLTFLVAGVLALLPVWRLYRAGWPTRWLATAWIVLALGIMVGVRFPGPFRLLLPILVLLYVAPFVAGPERLSRVLRGRRPEPGVIIDVTPKPAPGLPEPPEPPRRTPPGTDDASEPDNASEPDDASEPAGPGEQTGPGEAPAGPGEAQAGPGEQPDSR